MNGKSFHHSIHVSIEKQVRGSNNNDEYKWQSFNAQSTALIKELSVCM